jgi:type IV pilus assembly protein PilY1
MNILKHRERLTALAAAAAILSLLSGQAAHAGPLDITDTPLFLTSGVKPNLIMAIDDSGSMDFEVLLPGNDGSAWWRAGASGTCTVGVNNHSFVGCVANGSTDLPGAGRLNFNNGGTHVSTSGVGNVWKKYSYLFPNGYLNSNGTDRRRLNDATNDHFAIPPLPAFAWARSPEYNRAYFNPSTTYTRWVDNAPDYVFVDQEPTTTEYDPVFTGANTINLTQDVAGITTFPTTTACTNAALGATAVTANYFFRVQTGMIIPAGTCMRVSGRAWEVVRTGMTCAVGVNNACNVTLAGVNQTPYTVPTGSSVAFKYFPATFYLSASTPLPADYGYTGSTTATGFAPGDTLTPSLIAYELKPGNFASTDAYNAAIRNFANWFTYYRKRHQALRAGLGNAFDGLQGMRVAGFTINQATAASPPTSPNVTMGDIDSTTDRAALYANFYRNWVASGGTPNRHAVANLIRNFRRNDLNAPIQRSCQRNFGMLFTDGFSNEPAAQDGITAVGNADGAAGAPYQDNTSGTMADATYRAYNVPLRAAGDFALGKVKPQKGCELATPLASLDCKTDLHMNFYAITLGTRGLQFNPDADPAQNPYTTVPTWPTAFPPRHPSAVDDLWHATLNGRGKLVNASSSAELGDKLREVLGSMDPEQGSASSAAVNSGSINSETRLFQASFDSADWSGKLTARSVTTAGVLGVELEATLPLPDARQIVTVDGTGTPVPFTDEDIGPVRLAELQPDLDLDGEPDDEYGLNRLAWLRGDQTDENDASAINFRNRTIILGDIINSAPTFVGSPAFRYSDSLESAKYSDFRATYRTRDHMVYVGGNDGMLHAFYSDDTDSNSDGLADGPVRETFAFIPSAVFKNLHLLTAPEYSHRFYVDGTPVSGDAFVGGAWRTILVGGLNKGGQEIYALDVTNPDNLTEANAASIVKWEFTDADDADLGYTYSRPSIVRMNDGTWVAAFGNGYNNTVADGAASTTGRAYLYIVDLHTGALLRKIDTNVGSAAAGDKPNGLSTPVFIDTDNDSDVDIAYAGDLYGNLWKFDLSSGSPAAWDLAHDDPLFVAEADGIRQPITSRPNVARGPKGVGFVVLFGTGKYLESTDSDVTTPRTQSFYGLLDPNTGADTDRIGNGRDDLQPQTIWREVFDVGFPPNTADIRVTTNDPVGADKRGWYLDLVSPHGAQGEMQVTDSLIRNDHVVFTTLVPTADPCENGGSSWLMELNLFSGQRPASTPWDMNDNGLFDDVYTEGGVDYPISGVKTEVGITPKPAGLAGPKCDWLIFPGTSGGTEKRCRDPGPRGFGRQSWRQAH